MDDDFERRRELRRQKREEMRLEAEKNSELNDDEEEAARERRRRARQERLRNKENEDTAAMTAEGTGLNSTNSVIDAGKTTSSLISAASEDDQALLDRIAKREERRKRRMQDALERQKELDPTVTDGAEVNQDETSGNKTHYLEPESEENNKAPEQYSWREKDEKEEQSVNDTKQEDVKAPSERSAPEPNTAAVVEEEVGDGKLHGEESAKEKANISLEKNEEDAETQLIGSQVDTGLISTIGVETTLMLTKEEEGKHTWHHGEKDHNEKEKEFSKDEEVERLVEDVKTVKTETEEEHPIKLNVSEEKPEEKPVILKNVDETLLPEDNVEKKKPEEEPVISKAEEKKVDENILKLNKEEKKVEEKPVAPKKEGEEKKVEEKPVAPKKEGEEKKVEEKPVAPKKEGEEKKVEEKPVAPKKGEEKNLLSNKVVDDKNKAEKKPTPIKKEASEQKVEEKPVITKVIEEKKKPEERFLMKKEAEEKKKVQEKTLAKRELEEKWKNPKKEVEEKAVGKKEPEKKEEKPGVKAKFEDKKLPKKEEVAEEKSKKLFFKQQEVPDDKQKRSFKKEEVGEKKMTKEAEFLQKKKDITQQSKQQNGSLRDDQFGKVKKPETIPSRPNEARTQDPASRKLEEIKKRRGESESEEFEKMRQKQQEAEAELEELKKKRDERKKVLEQEENQKKQELAEKKAKEEEEKRRMKEEIEKRRAEAAEKRQKVEDAADGDTKKPFTCVSPKGSSLKIGVRAEFLNKSAQKSTSSLKASHTPIVSKIGNRLEQYNSAIQSNRDVKSPKSPTSDLPLVTDGIRNIKSMWQKGNVSASPAGPASPGATNKEAAGMKTGVAGRINDWGTKTPESSKAAGGKPADLKPGDVTNKRNLWEAKMSDASKSKTVTNAGMGH